MSAKAKGTRNEHRSMRLLEAAGYAVTRAAASLGAWDLIGIGSTDVVLVQVKTRDWPGLVEMETLRMFAAPANCRKLVHRWRHRQRTPDVREVARITPAFVEAMNALTVGDAAAAMGVTLESVERA